jgi:hypothetical protein
MMNIVLVNIAEKYSVKACSYLLKCVRSFGSVRAQPVGLMAGGISMYGERPYFMRYVCSRSMPGNCHTQQQTYFTPNPNPSRWVFSDNNVTQYPSLFLKEVLSDII